MHDSTIQDLAAQKPQTLQELQNINGLGPIKIMKYGDEILNIINGY